MKRIWPKYAGSVIAVLFLGSLHAQEVRVDLTALYNMRIGATCEELAASYAKLLEKADRGLSTLSTTCFPDTDFSRDEISFKSIGKSEWVKLEYTPEGKLWSVWSNVTFTRGLGPVEDVAVQTLTKRFGVPAMYSDVSRDSVIRNNLRENGSSEMTWMAAWSNEKAAWTGSVNTHVYLTPCKSVVGAASVFKCQGDRLTQGTRSWDTHLASLKGIVTTVLLVTEATTDGPRVVRLRTKMYDPKFVARADAFYKKRSESLREQSNSRDAERLPKF